MFDNLSRPIAAKTRSICAENLTGEKGKGGMTKLNDGSAKNAARDLGDGWKVNPFVVIKAGETFTMADIKDQGVINHIWLTLTTDNWRNSILRMYWDDSVNPSVESPIGDFFCMGWQQYSQINSLAVCVNPGRALNCYWDMPFKKRALITLENRGDEDVVLYYQIDYRLQEVPDDTLYFHAQFRRVNPLPYKGVYTILDGVEGQGNYVGTFINWGAHNSGWWGEGEIKFYMDGDDDYPTICGTGTEDYFCGSWNFEVPGNPNTYCDFSGPYTGFVSMKAKTHYDQPNRFSMYRWHLNDPICFEHDLRVTIQALGWRQGGRYLPLKDDISSVAYWYQTLPQQKFPPLGDRDELENI